MAHPSTFYPRRTRIPAQRNARRDTLSRVQTPFSYTSLLLYPSRPFPPPHPSRRFKSDLRDLPTSTPTPPVFGYPYRDSNSGLIEGLCAMKDRNPTLRPLSAVLRDISPLLSYFGYSQSIFQPVTAARVINDVAPYMERILPRKDG